MHEWKIDRGKVFQKDLTNQKDPELTDIQGSHLLHGGDVVVNLEYVGMVRLNSCSEVLWTLAEGNHHSISQAEDGTFWVPGVSQKPTNGSKLYPEGYPGLNVPVWMDRVLQVSQDGRILQDIKVLDVIYKNNLERYIARATGRKVNDTHLREHLNRDITHLNDIEPLRSSMADEYPLFEAGDLVVSLRQPSLVFVFDPDTEKVKWYAHDPFIHQHDPDFIGNGWIGVFDNNEDFTKRGTMLGGSRIVALQPHTNSMKTMFPTEHSETFYTKERGKWQLLRNGNLLLTEASAGRAVEVDSHGRTVWEWIQKPTDNSRVPSVSKVSLHDLKKSDIRNWPCSSINTSADLGDSK